MTTDELFKHITSEPKWYAGKFSPQIASRIKRHYKKGIYRPDSLVRLFAKFGYVQTEIIWKMEDITDRIVKMENDILINGYQKGKSLWYDNNPIKDI